jgi:hypothetical protein
MPIWSAAARSIVGSLKASAVMMSVTADRSNASSRPADPKSISPRPPSGTRMMFPG